MRALDDNMNPRWPNMVHILEPKASKTVKNTTFFKHFHFCTMSQCCYHMSPCGHFFGPIWPLLGPFFLPPPPSFLCFFNFFSHCFWWCINACIGWQHEAKNPKWPNMVHILEPKASKIVKNNTFFKHCHFWTMSQFGRHMSLHGHFCGPNWCHLGPFFLPPPSFLLRGMGGCVTIFRCCINACIGRQHGPKMTQHGSHIGTQHYHIGVFWSILDHLEATLAKYGAQLGSILVHFGPFWTHWGRTWN